MSNKSRRPDMRKMFTKCGDEREGSGVWMAQLLHPPDPSYLPSPGVGLPRRWPKRQTQSHTINPNPQERAELTAGSEHHFWNELEGLEETILGRWQLGTSRKTPSSLYPKSPFFNFFFNFYFLRQLTISPLTRNQLSLSILPEILPLRLVQIQALPSCPAVKEGL